MRLPSPLFWIGCLCLFIGVALQFQITLFYTYEAYKGLRLCFADLALPVAGLAIGVSLLQRKSLWPIWTVPHFYAWLGGLFIVLLAALFQSHALFDEWSRWGITNKLPGILVVSAYACLGGWLGTNAGERNIFLLLRCMAVFFIGLMLVETALTCVQDFWRDGHNAYRSWPDYPLKGLIDNRNAYALFALMMYSFLLCFAIEDRPILPRPLLYVCAGLMPYFLIQVGSRAGFIAAAIMAVILIFFYRKKILPYLFAVLLGGILTFGIYFNHPEKLLLFHFNQLDIIERVETMESRPENFTAMAENIGYVGDDFRLQILDISFDMIKQRPLFGSGLGSSFFVQEDIRGRYDVIESTPIWLWVETGLFGLAAFGAFYFFCARAIIRNMKGDDFHATLNRAMFVSLAVFTVMTCLHEMMMTRQVWFLLGLALALPAAHIRKRQGV